MRCFFHPQAHATATCGGCRRALCHGCTSRFSTVHCEGCIVAHDNVVASQHRKNLILTALLVVAGFITFGAFPTHGTAQPALLRGEMAILFPCVFWGWKFLSEHTPRVLLVLPIPVWIVILTIKLMLAGFVGLVVAPWRIFRSVRDLVRIREVARSIGAARGAAPAPVREPPPAVALRELPSSPTPG